MEFILASANAHKAQELNELLKLGGLDIIPAASKVDVVEDGTSFEENAFKKASGYFQKFKQPCVSDDSGLVIPARKDILGIYSARYADEFEDYKDKNRILLEDIQALKGDEREAYFACSLCFYISAEEVYFFEGRVHGKISHRASGDDGFGYDPIFLPNGRDGKSLAELPDWKMINSHRAKACGAASKFFKNK
ncbi:MAG: non-canonical purine NTP pyrophosphatase [Halobacteriovoraceae bacterium]|jgi:XTP/dITP diphosphohydrolase|nr:non-canonical purine NTP pyrophosphatase [Halobacteriovoraceae bacterium]